MLRLEPKMVLKLWLENLYEPINLGTSQFLQCKNLERLKMLISIFIVFTKNLSRFFRFEDFQKNFT